MLNSKLWRSLHNKFELLSNQLRGKAQRYWLRAYSEYNGDLFSIKERKALDRGLWCLLDKPEYWVWRLSEGPNSRFRAQFDAIAARAGGSLDRKPLAGISLGDFWLDHVFFHLRRRSTDQFSSVDGAGACIPNICDASAIFCSFLEQRGLESERRAKRIAHGSAGKRSNRRGRIRSERHGSPGWSDEYRRKLRNREWLKAQPSLSQKEAAYSLAYSDRYIRKLAQDHKLSQSTKKRIEINNSFWTIFNLKHGGPK